MSDAAFLLDCDPGIDDAFAIFCASAFGDCSKIATVSGNVPIEHTTRNARYVAELAGLTATIHRGSDRPLRVEASFAGEVHGPAGLGTSETPDSSITESAMTAIDAIVEHGSTIGAVFVATGPLTNIARAFQQAPELVDTIGHLHWMGGSLGPGNVTAHAEFNAWADPHAAKQVLESGVTMTMYGLNLTHQVRMFPEHSSRLRASGTPTGRLAADWLDFYASRGAPGSGQPMHDPCAILGHLRPDLFDFEQMVVRVDADEAATRGATVSVASEDEGGSSIRVAVSASVDEILDLIIDAATLPTPRR